MADVEVFSRDRGFVPRFNLAGQHDLRRVCGLDCPISSNSSRDRCSCESNGSGCKFIVTLILRRPGPARHRGLSAHHSLPPRGLRVLDHHPESLTSFPDRKRCSSRRDFTPGRARTLVGLLAPLCCSASSPHRHVGSGAPPRSPSVSIHLLGMFRGSLVAVGSTRLMHLDALPFHARLRGKRVGVADRRAQRPSACAWRSM